MKKKILTTFTLSTFLLVFTVSHAPIQAEDNVVTDYEGFEGENFGNNVFLPLVGRDYEENTVIDFEGLAEGEIVDFPLRYGVGISGVEIEGEITVEGFNPNFGKEVNAAMIFDAICDGVCSGEDDDLYFPELGNGLIISEDLDPSDPDDAESPGDFYFEFDFTKFGNGTVNLKKLTYADIDGNEPPGSIEVFKGNEPVKDPIPLPQTGDNRKREVNIDANDIDHLVVRFYGSMMIDNIEIEIKPTTSPFDVTIGYEDREMGDVRIDYDYNDWVVSIDTDLQGENVSLDTIKLKKITFKMMPKARGGKIYHEFHFGIDANTFKSDGDSELIIHNTLGDPLITKEKRFKASEIFDFPINFHKTGCDCEAFGPDKGEPHTMYNVIEGDPNDPKVEAIRWAELSITFDESMPFLLPNPGYKENCQGLFFDPHLLVTAVNKSGKEIKYKISRTPNIDDPNPDPRILCVPDTEWQWPEEGKGIDLAYPDVKCKNMIPDFPPDIEWYAREKATECAYKDDEVICPNSKISCLNPDPSWGSVTSQSQ
jgi:hypothetical protein